MNTPKQFTPAQVQEFSQWVGGLCRGRSDSWKVDLLESLLAARPMIHDDTQTTSMTTAKGNTLQLFYNNETGLVVVDLVDKDDTGGNEFVRMTIDENKLLGHTTKTRKRKT